MIFDTTDVPDSDEDRVGKAYTELLCRSWRNTLFWLKVHILAGWTAEQHRHWVETGEEPQR